MTDDTRCFGLTCLGVVCRVETPDLEFAAFVERNYAPFLTAAGNQADIVVRFAADAGEVARADAARLDRAGPEVAVGRECLCWFNPFGFAAMFTASAGSELKVDGYHFALRNPASAEERQKNYQRAMRWMVHFPIFILLRERGIHLAHASAVADANGGLVFCGHGGVGKSTLAMTLVQKHGYQLVTDNFLLADERRLYGFPDVTRLDAEALEHLGVSSPATHTVYGKLHVALPSEKIALTAKPRACFLVTNGSPLEVASLPSERAIRIVEGIHTQISELPEHSPLAMLPYLERFRDLPAPAIAPALARAPWFRLRMPKDWSTANILRAVESCI